MTNNTFTEDEEFLLMSVPAMIGSAVSMSEKSGVIGTVKEAMSSAKALVSGVQDYPGNQVLKQVLPVIAERQEAIEKAKTYKTKAFARMKDNGINSPEKFKHQMLQDCRDAARILDGKASAQDKAEYKEWTMKLAEKVAMAAKEGSFLGFGGQRVSPGEVEMIAEISNALGTESPFAEV